MYIIINDALYIYILRTYINKQSFYSEVGDYRTRIDSRGYCWIRIRGQSVRTIPKISGFMHIYSPGYYR